MSREGVTNCLFALVSTFFASAPMHDSSMLQLTCRPDLNVFTVRWLTDSVFATMRAEYESVLQAEGATRWLLDVRRRPSTTPEAAQWVTADWLPRAATLAQPARLRLAYLVAPTRVEALRDDARLRIIMEAALLPSQHYDLGTFAAAF